MVYTKNRFIKNNYTLSHGKLTENRHNNEPLALGDQVPVVWHKAKDFNIYDENGNKWIDMTAGIFAATPPIGNPYPQ